jgi:hypothetical protein
MTDDLFDLAASVQTTPRGGSPTAPARAVADSEGRAGDPPVSGAVSGFTLPQPPPRNPFQRSGMWPS